MEALTEWGAPVHVEIGQERFRELGLQKGDEVFMTPRDVAVFAKD